MKSSDLNELVDAIHHLTNANLVKNKNKKFANEECQMFYIQALANLELARTSMRIAALKLYLEE